MFIGLSLIGVGSGLVTSAAAQPAIGQYRREDCGKKFLDIVSKGPKYLANDAGARRRGYNGPRSRSRQGNRARPPRLQHAGFSRLARGHAGAENAADGPLGTVGGVDGSQNGRANGVSLRNRSSILALRRAVASWAAISARAERALRGRRRSQDSGTITRFASCSTASETTSAPRRPTRTTRSRSNQSRGPRHTFTLWFRARPALRPPDRGDQPSARFKIWIGAPPRRDACEGVSLSNMSCRPRVQFDRDHQGCSVLAGYRRLWGWPTC